jgi:hypothetical protein
LLNVDGVLLNLQAEIEDAPEAVAGMGQVVLERAPHDLAAGLEARGRRLGEESQYALMQEGVWKRQI